MTQLEHLPSLPTSEDYKRGVTRLINEDGITDAAAIDRIVHTRASRSHSFNQHMTTIAMLAGTIERFDRSTEKPVDPLRETSKTLARGAGFGTLLVPYVHGEAVPIHKIFDSQATFRVSGNTDQFQIRHEVAAQVMNDGYRGLDLISEDTQEMLESIEPRIIPDATKQHFFRVGVGMIILSAYNTHQQTIEEHRQLDLQQMQRELAGLNSTYDWTGAFQNLLGNEKS